MSNFPRRYFVALLLLLAQFMDGYSFKADPVVTTPSGTVKGTILTTRKGKEIYSFLGVRYAEAPVKELRFKPPVSVKPWEGVYDATKNSLLCPQSSINETQASEDCLFLNVYTRNINKTGHNITENSVMVFFYPGGFYEGTSSSDYYGPEYLLDEDIVLVVPNYRLQTLGFLATGTAEAPGNNGLKDQVEVLRWIQKHIASFGGNPNDVTISGCSAGGMSVTAHMVSPMSKGLFHKVISISGTAFGPYTIGNDLMRLANRQAELVGCPIGSPRQMVECFETKSAQELSGHIEGFREFLKDPAGIWGLVIEKDFGQERFLTEHPIKSVLNKRVADVPVMIGVTNDEFGVKSFDIVNNETALKEFDVDYKRIWPISFCYERNTNFSFKTSEALREFYFPDDKIDTSKRQGIADLYADGIIGFGSNRGAKILSENLESDVYYYRFNYKNRYSFFYLPGTNDTIPYGASHEDDVLYLFYIKPLTPMFKVGEDGNMVEKMTTILGNFIRNGNPNSDEVNWPVFDNENESFLDINSDLSVGSKLFDARYKTWEDLFPLSMY